MRYLFAVLCLLAALAICATRASAEPDDEDDKGWTDWGAVALGPRGAFGFAVHKDTGADAERAARTACHGACTRVLAFHDACGAVAVGRKGVNAWGVGPNADEARRHALDLCTLDASDCRIRAAGCTD